MFYSTLFHLFNYIYISIYTAWGLEQWSEWQKARSSAIFNDTIALWKNPITVWFRPAVNNDTRPNLGNSKTNSTSSSSLFVKRKGRNTHTKHSLAVGHRWTRLILEAPQPSNIVNYSIRHSFSPPPCWNFRYIYVYLKIIILKFVYW